MKEINEYTTADEINTFFMGRIPQLEEGMRIHQALGYIAVYIMALEEQLENAQK